MRREDTIGDFRPAEGDLIEIQGTTRLEVPILAKAAGKLPGKAVQQVGVPYTFDDLDIE